MARRNLALVVLAALVVPVACGEGSDAGGGSASATSVTIPADRFTDQTGESEVTVSVVDNDFVDPFITVTAGTKVRWSHDGRNPHNIQPQSGSAFGVDVDQFGAGQTYSYRFTKPGEYPYYCSVHGTRKLSGQAGVIRVVAKE